MVMVNNGKENGVVKEGREIKEEEVRTTVVSLPFPWPTSIGRGLFSKRYSL